MRTRRFELPSYWPAGVALLCSLVITARSLAWSLQLNDGQLIYGLDDAYIHLSMARTLAQTGVWGITPHAFTAASSSPLWTVSLAVLIRLVGDLALLPLLVNLFLGGALAFVTNALLRQYGVPALYRVILTTGLVALLPIDSLILSGMEHLLHLVLSLVFAHEAAQSLQRDEQPPLRSWRASRVWLLGLLVSSARYEGLFLVALFGGLFVLRRRVIFAALLVLCSAAPSVLLGLVALGNGWPFLPASLLLKSSAAQNLAQTSFDGLRFYLIDQPLGILADHTFTFPLVLALGSYLVIFPQRRSVWDARLTLLLVLMGAIYLNVRLVSWPFPGPLLRYEAYLVGLAWVILPAALGELLPRRFQWAGLPAYAMTVVLLLFSLRDLYVRYQYLIYTNPIITATQNIYWQQWQMGRFLARYYDGAVVAANDIGAITYTAELRLIDLYGLGTREVVNAKLERRYTTDEMQRIADANGAQIAIVYETWYDAYGGLPSEWVLVGRWTLPPARNVVLGNHEVAFYAIDPAQTSVLATHLREFTPRLPPIVETTLLVPLPEG